ncbi:MAG: aminotransferase class I/II-fold pyridoxal phosphate-dependent enzyme [Candidatus Latescibacterota bacterium]|nr:aminotransferase class I/II-fold pyridoxal phosphate-dependent enzyme [Candidatus Latescibacterota bacterium]
MAELALFGGPKEIKVDGRDIFRWPIVTSEDENAVLEVLRRGAMSGTDVTLQFEQEIKEYFGSSYALCHNTGTAAIQAAMWACGLKRGDEVICQSMTYWGSALQAFSLGATVVFGEMDPQTLTLDPDDIESRITDRTKAIIVVHYSAYPTDMDPIMEIAGRHGVKVIEDVSHAQGGLYKGRLLGTIGHVGAMSIMSGKSLPAGEGGFLVTEDKEVYERAVAFGHYQRMPTLDDPCLNSSSGMPLGGYKYRMHQLSSAVGRVQLANYSGRMKVIQKAMNYFWDKMEGIPGIKAHRPAAESGSTMGGWYAAKGLYVAEELGGLSVSRFCEALNAEGVEYRIMPGANILMHLHPVMNEVDVYGDGRPTRIAFSDRDVRQGLGSLPVTESLPEKCLSVPWFKHYRPEVIDEYVEAFRKVASRFEDLL